MAKPVQVSTTKPDNLNSTPETHILEGGNQPLHGDLRPSLTCSGIWYTHTHTHRQNKNEMNEIPTH